jgi:nitrogen fixation protein FixH
MSSARRPRPLTGRFVLITMIAFFTIVMGVNVVMIRLAVATLPGTEVDSAYAASLAYQREINAAHQQQARSWQVEAHLVRKGDGTATLDLRARDRNAVPVTGAVFSARLERPADRRADRAIDVVDIRGGQYRGTAEDVAAGQWDLVIEADADGKRMFLSKSRIVLQ